MKWIRVQYIDIKKRQKEMLINLDAIKFLFAEKKDDFITGTDYIVHGFQGDLYMTEGQFRNLEGQLGVEIPIWEVEI